MIARRAHNALPWHEHALMRSLARRGVPHRKIARSFGRAIGTVHSICRGATRPRVPRTCAEQRLIAKLRRDELRAGRWCINGKGHGKATHGVRCEHCADVHRKSA